MNGKILVVEDEPAIADSIVYALQTEGFETIWHSTGGDAKTSMLSQDYDLIILDVGLPDCSGFDLCREIRANSDIPVLFLTARSDEIDRVVGLEIGGDDYVTKPFSPRELSARVRAILRRTGNNSNDEVNGEFEIDTKRRQISYKGSPLELSRYEYRLLKIFIERPGWVYSREQLMQMAWEEPEFSSDRTVDAHIKTLRAKLKAIDPEANPIQTHRGEGYSLRESD